MKYFIPYFLLTLSVIASTPSALVFQSDFGLSDGAVSSMKGVAYGISPKIPMFDLSHDIPPYDIWIASLTLQQTAPYWPQGTVFVSVVDPGVGTERKSVVLKTKSGHYFVTPDNGTLTFVADTLGVEAIREIDEAINRRKDSKESYTFHGRDVYAYTGARLAAEVIRFEEVGPTLDSVKRLPYQQAAIDQNSQTVHGTILNLDVRYGNVWTNIPQSLLDEFGLQIGDWVNVQIKNEGLIVYQQSIPYCETFGSVEKGTPLLYLNSLLNVAFGLNMDNFAMKNSISYGSSWSVQLSKK